jgi:hypothetical protein
MYIRSIVMQCVDSVQRNCNEQANDLKKENKQTSSLLFSSCMLGGIYHVMGVALRIWYVVTDVRCNG